jgi:hypothetical protein
MAVALRPNSLARPVIPRQTEISTRELLAQIEAEQDEGAALA